MNKHRVDEASEQIKSDSSEELPNQNMFLSTVKKKKVSKRKKKQQLGEMNQNIVFANVESKFVWFSFD